VVGRERGSFPRGPTRHLPAGVPVRREPLDRAGV